MSELVMAFCIRVWLNITEMNSGHLGIKTNADRKCIWPCAYQKNILEDEKCLLE